jgi:hypothetical protein
MEQALFPSLQGHVSLQPTTKQVDLGYRYRTLKVILMDLRTIRPKKRKEFQLGAFIMERCKERL